MLFRESIAEVEEPVPMEEEETAVETMDDAALEAEEKRLQVILVINFFCMEGVFAQLKQSFMQEKSAYMDNSYTELKHTIFFYLFDTMQNDKLSAASINFFENRKN